MPPHPLDQPIPRQFGRIDRGDATESGIPESGHLLPGLVLSAFDAKTLLRQLSRRLRLRGDRGQEGFRLPRKVSVHKVHESTPSTTLKLHKSTTVKKVPGRESGASFSRMTARSSR